MQNKILHLSIFSLILSISFCNAQQLPTGNRLKDIPAGPRLGITVTHGRFDVYKPDSTGLLSGPYTNQIQTIVNREFNMGTAVCYPNKYDGWGDGFDNPIQFEYSRFNASVNWLVQRNKLTIMHMLCGPNIYAPAWFKYGNWSPVRQDSLLKSWIYSIMESNDNKNKVKIWNVVNEALNEDGSFKNMSSVKPYNTSEGDSANWCKWYEMGLEADASGTAGTSDYINDSIPVYIRKAFEYAADKTENILELRENHIEIDSRKSRAFYQLVRHLLNKGVQLGAVGPQCHFDLQDADTLNVNEFTQQIKRYTNLGLQVYFTEVDFNDKYPPFTNLKAEKQKQDYKKLMEIAIKTGVSGVNLWGLTDGNISWLGTGSPHPFTQDFRVKPAYYGIQEALTEAVNKYDTLATGIYSFKAKHSGKLLKVKQSDTANGTAVWQYELTGSVANQWQVTHVGGGFHKLIAVCSGKALDVQGISCRDGAFLQQWFYDAGDNQLWKFEKQANNFYKIAARNSGKALDVSGISIANGALVQQWRFGNGDNQLWSLEKIGNANKKAMAVANENNIATQISINPNPVQNNATINYALVNDSYVSIELLDINQKRLKNIFSGKQKIGTYNQNINLGDVTSGVYFVKVSVGNEPIIMKEIVKN